jgi:hypothetical protein
MLSASGLRRRFNGAAVFQPRMSDRFGYKFGVTEELQWGRGFSTAEMRRRSTAAASVPPGFNGAAVVQPRNFSGVNGKALRPFVLQCGRGELVAEVFPMPADHGPGEAASMGPRLFSRGNQPCGKVMAMPSSNSLQWGRGFSAAETTSTCTASKSRLPCFNGAAAFQPRRSTSSRARLRASCCFNGATTHRPWKCSKSPS